MAPIKVLFMGTPDFAVPALEALYDRPDLFEVRAVVSQPDRPRGRGRSVAASPVKRCAEAHGTQVFTPKKMRAQETWAALAGFGADVAVVAAYGRILPKEILAIPPRGCINLHASLLPRFRGASPIARAIWAGDAETGVCVMGMEEGLDTGPVYARAHTPIAPDDTTGTLTARLAELGAQALVASLPSIVDGSLQATPQSADGITLAPPLHKSDGCLDFAGDPWAIARQVRALSPWPGTFAWMGPERVAILEAFAESYESAAPEGTIVKMGPDGMWVACARGALRITQVKPAGRNAMAAQAWAAGRGPKVGRRWHAGPVEEP